MPAPTRTSSLPDGFTPLTLACFFDRPRSRAPAAGSRTVRPPARAERADRFLPIHSAVADGGSRRDRAHAPRRGHGRERDPSRGGFHGAIDAAPAHRDANEGESSGSCSKGTRLHQASGGTSALGGAEAAQRPHGESAATPRPKPNARPDVVGSAGDEPRPASRNCGRRVHRRRLRGSSPEQRQRHVDRGEEQRRGRRGTASPARPGSCGAAWRRRRRRGSPPC